MTAYIVLRELEVGANQYERLPKTHEASSARAAIRDEIRDNGGVAGTYVAVPASSWQPVALEVQLQVRVRDEEELPL